jgi:hypothetical protein
VRVLQSGVSRAASIIGLVLLVALAVFRWRVVNSWHVPAGDGIEYFHLSQELTEHDRYAHGSREPLTYVRLPGYPLFLTHVAVRRAPAPLETHLRRATHANVLLDVGTALLVLLVLLDRQAGAPAAILGAALVLVCPILLFLCCYGLTESLATFLVTGMLAAAVLAMRRRLFPLAAVAGVFAGLAQLVRVSSAVTLPSVVLALMLAEAPLKRRVQAVLLCGACALAVFAPWPLRNLARFGAPHPLGAEWESSTGAPLPPGAPHWMRAWATGLPGESYLSLMIVGGHPLNERVLMPQMYDDDDEKKQVLALFDRYNREGLSPAVDAQFAALADARQRRRPLRALVGLPWRRLVALWSPMPEWELPMRTDVLNLPVRRERFGHVSLGLYLLGFVGLGVLLRRRQRALAVILVGGTALTSVLHAYMHAFPVERYLAPTLPPLLALAALALTAPLALLRRRRSATA